MSYKLYDLSQQFYNGAAMWPKIAPDLSTSYSTFTGIRGANHPEFPYRYNWPIAGGGSGWIGHLHCGTHVDAPIYAIDGSLTLEKMPLENLYGTGMVLDFRKKKKWDKITAEDLEKATPKIQKGDFVVCNTGWQKHFRPDKSYEYYHHYPALVPDAAEWLIKKKVKAIAGTWPVTDHSLAFAPLNKFMPWLYEEYKKATGKDPTTEFPSFEPCLTMLLNAGVTCVQNAGGDIDQVTGKRCTFAAFPFRVEEADAGMVRLVAIVE